MNQRLLPTLLLVACSLLSCEARAQSAELRQAPAYAPDAREYPFAEATDLVRLDAVFRPPADFSRVAVAPDSFGDWLRGLPLLRGRTTVHNYRGERVASPAAAIVAIDVGERNLQQCADSAIRLDAEYLWARQRADEIAYHFTSGDEARFADWLDGERITVDGAAVRRSTGSAREASHASLREWLDMVFMYAGTRSLARDSEPIRPTAIQAGDFFVSPGSPGHAVVVLDVAQSADGRRVAVLGQGFMPAQEFHVIRAAEPAALDGVWFILPDSADDLLRTPSWRPFRGADVRRFH